ncbi:MULTISPECIES: DUF3240 family protein [Shewanella]|jgi:hypothetical protein|uniref:Uncharacterized protein DUF3240 n=1 Tax=Shewanella fodinae TaxID=552357 RepID=A0A4R2FBX3_9GAMM|nr:MULTISPECIES: DUF3240 family protein [Shewanella]MBO1272510.1 DUF3240 family protein [Shewanella sp. 4t3-1-2LB]MCL2906706.1 DUF3240 family protein [Shewanella fodinae]TCN84254.1 uncharacterized protein DUF3240 [Shewanella fodinae]GGZ03006.1 hypothetical protein GCM10007169_19800 [Shewanella fodinae]
MKQLLVLIAQHNIKDDIVDTLMSLDYLSGFSLVDICGFSREHSQYNLKEQVEGYRQFYKFEIMHPQQSQEALLTTLAQVCQHNPCRYWIVPIASNGVLGQGQP